MFVPGSTLIVDAHGCCPNKVAKRANTGIDTFNLTDQGRLAVHALQIYDRPKPVPSMQLHTDAASEDLHMFELMQKLFRNRWTCRLKPAKARLAPYTEGSEKVFWRGGGCTQHICCVCWTQTGFLKLVCGDCITTKCKSIMSPYSRCRPRSCQRCCPDSLPASMSC